MGKAGELIARLKDYSFGPFLPDCVREALRQAATLLASQEAEIEALRKSNEEAQDEIDTLEGDAEGMEAEIQALTARALAAEARVAEEREACACLGTSLRLLKTEDHGYGSDGYNRALENYAALIRARGQS